MPRQRIKIPNSDGLELSARLDLPVGGPASALALFAHCFTCTKNIKAISHISDSLTQEGIAVLRFDFIEFSADREPFKRPRFPVSVHAQSHTRTAASAVNRDLKWIPFDSSEQAVQHTAGMTSLRFPC